jgi:hypothetical protein
MLELLLKGLMRSAGVVLLKGLEFVAGVERILLKRESLALGVSVFALTISVLTFWLSSGDRLVTFEQRRQEVKLLTAQGQILGWEIGDELQRVLGHERDAVRRKQLSEGLRAVQANDKDFEKILGQIDAMQSHPLIPWTHERVDLEQLAGQARLINEQAQAILQKLRLSSAQRKVRQ